MKAYQDLVRKILEEGTDKRDRTGTGTRSIFGHQLRFDLSEGFPLVTTKKTHFKSVAAELLWFLRGSDIDANSMHIDWLKEQGVTIWDEWADKYGYLGPIYGAQWRNWGGQGIDQIQEVIEQIKSDPDSRRHLVSSWNVSDLPEMALAPCHVMFQFYVADGKLSCHMYQRSADVFLGLPFNIASYALLTHMIAQVCGLDVGDLIISIGDAHLYSNHLEQAKELLTREPRKLPTLYLQEGLTDIDYFGIDSLLLVDYDPHPAIKAPVAI